MPGSEDIVKQQELLRVYRQTLHTSLTQQGIHGSANVPPAAVYSINEAREQIRRIKAILRNWDVAVEDLPNDESLDQPSASGNTPSGAIQAPLNAVVDKRALRETLVVSFSLAELRSLCLDIEQDLAKDGINVPVNLELLEGEDKTSKVLALIGYLERRRYLHYLVAATQRARPNR